MLTPKTDQRSGDRETRNQETRNQVTRNQETPLSGKCMSFAGSSPYGGE
jgi:hypothetical protein